MNFLADILQFVDTKFEFSSLSELLPICVEDIGNGLDYSHNNIVNRDPKPSNNLVCNQHLGGVAHDEAATSKPCVVKLC